MYSHVLLGHCNAPRLLLLQITLTIPSSLTLLAATIGNQIISTLENATYFGPEAQLATAALGADPITDPATGQSTTGGASWQTAIPHLIQDVGVGNEARADRTFVTWPTTRELVVAKSFSIYQAGNRFFARSVVSTLTKKPICSKHHRRADTLVSSNC